MRIAEELDNGGNSYAATPGLPTKDKGHKDDCTELILSVSLYSL